jgi:membrane associated rhomboid family serine protease
VESEGRFVRFSYNADEVDVDSICLWLPANAAADQFVALIAANAIVFIATLIAGAEWITPVGKMQIAWGSNFAPDTTDGEWWRLFTSMFIHFGLPHLVFNMLALGMFGPI